VTCCSIGSQNLIKWLKVRREWGLEGGGNSAGGAGRARRLGGIAAATVVIDGRDTTLY